MLTTALRPTPGSAASPHIKAIGGAAYAERWANIIKDGRMKIIPIIMRKSSDEENQELADVIASKIPDSLVYQRHNVPGIYAATGDWMVILSVTSSFIC